MTDLKRCPFCGKAVAIRDATTNSAYGGVDVSMQIICWSDNCNVQMQRSRISRPEEVDSVKTWLREHLTEDWNRRARSHLTGAKATRKSPPKKTKEDSHDRKPRSRSTSL